MAHPVALRKLRPSANPVRAGMTIIALTSSTPTMRIDTTVVRAMSMVSTRFSAATGTPLVRASSSLQRDGEERPVEDDRGSRPPPPRAPASPRHRSGSR